MALGLCQGKISTRRALTAAQGEGQGLQDEAFRLPRRLEREVRVMDCTEPTNQLRLREPPGRLEKIERTEGVHVADPGRRPVVPLSGRGHTRKDSGLKGPVRHARVNLPVQARIHNPACQDEAADRVGHHAEDGWRRLPLSRESTQRPDAHPPHLAPPTRS